MGDPLSLEEARLVHRALQGSDRIAVYRAFAETPDGFAAMATRMFDKALAKGRFIDEDGTWQDGETDRTSQDMAGQMVRIVIEERDRRRGKAIEKGLEATLSSEERADAVVEALYDLGGTLDALGAPTAPG